MKNQQPLSPRPPKFREALPDLLQVKPEPKPAKSDRPNKPRAQRVRKKKK